VSVFVLTHVGLSQSCAVEARPESLDATLANIRTALQFPGAAAVAMKNVRRGSVHAAPDSSTGNSLE
jgi:hypothetical protein